MLKKFNWTLSTLPHHFFILELCWLCWMSDFLFLHLSIIEPPTPGVINTFFWGEMGTETEKCPSKLGWIRDGNKYPSLLSGSRTRAWLLYFKRWQLWVLKLLSVYSLTHAWGADCCTVKISFIVHRSPLVP